MPGPRGSVRAPGRVLAAGCVLVVAWITLDVLWRGPWTRLDAAISGRVHGWGLRGRVWPDHLLYALTLFGGRAEILVLVGGFALILSWRRRTWQPLLRFVVALALLTVTVYAFKLGVGRTAPPSDLLHAGGESYPSGHVPNAVLMWGLAAWLAADYAAPGAVRQVLNWLRFVAPLLAAVGMLLLDYHWFSDLVAGGAVGILLLWVLLLVVGGRDRGDLPV